MGDRGIISNVNNVRERSHKSEFNGVFIMKVESDSYICKDYDGNLFLLSEQVC